MLDQTPTLFIEPIIGWRLWEVIVIPQRRERRALLFPPLRSGSGPWRPKRRFSAGSCYGYGALDLSIGISFPHNAPHPACCCGILAFPNEQTARRSMYLHAENVYAVGRVALWGRVIEHERGWRAQYAYPYDLILINGNASIASMLRNAYAVDVSLDALPVPQNPA